MTRSARLATLALTLAAAAPAAAAPPRGPYDVKSGHLVQKGDVMGATRVEVWWDDHGAREARHTVTITELLGKKLKIERLEIRTPERTINVDLDKKTGTVTAGMVPARQDDVSGMSAKMRADYRVEVLPERVVATKPCQGLSMEPMKGFPIRTWTWKGIPMLTQTRVGSGMATLEAISIETDVAVPAGTFSPPDGVQLTKF